MPLTHISVMPAKAVTPGGQKHVDRRFRAGATRGEDGYHYSDRTTGIRVVSQFEFAGNGGAD